ncbi:MAG TPA: hypothetical protein VIJ07_21220 [Dermatophilaceae bacterium]|jgi:hypothetical protein
MEQSTYEIRLRVDEIVQRLRTDEDFKAKMVGDAEGTLVSAGLGEEAAVILADDWRGAGGQFDLKCQVNNSCRFTDSTDPCGPTATSLRSC